MTSAPITIYSDGSCNPNPGPGGWGAVLLFGGSTKVVELQGCEENSTNNRMELTAALKAMQSLGEGADIDVFTDSKYLQRGITEWIDGWQRNGWRTRDKSPVKNKDLWELLVAELQRHRINWHWVKGHAGDRWNIRADELAASARKSRYTEVQDNNAIRLFTGVTWKNSTNRGGWATILSYRQHIKVLGGAVQGATANKLYLVAVIEGLKALKKDLPVHLYSKSGYLRDGVETWIEGWQKRNWRTREGGTVSNKEEWQEIAELKAKYSVQVVPLVDDQPPCNLQEAKILAQEFEQNQINGEGGG